MTKNCVYPIDFEREVENRIRESFTSEQIRDMVLEDVVEELSLSNCPENNCYNKNLQRLVRFYGEEISSYFCHDEEGYLLKVSGLKQKFANDAQIMEAYKKNVIIALTHLERANEIFKRMIEDPRLKHYLIPREDAQYHENGFMKKTSLQILSE